uniref:Uncharacterized protein n=1 Tax=Oryza sativa subsp. japonica TaxID=39947 RepID=Q6YS09_ORYSJ|nr:hypothetical protein [Oryza sativa Japonica Group]
MAWGELWGCGGDVPDAVTGRAHGVYGGARPEGIGRGMGCDVHVNGAAAYPSPCLTEAQPEPTTAEQAEIRQPVHLSGVAEQMSIE